MGKQISLKELLGKKVLKEDKVSPEIQQTFDNMSSALAKQWESIEHRWKLYLREDQDTHLKQGIVNIDGLIDDLKRFKKITFEAQLKAHKAHKAHKG